MVALTPHGSPDQSGRQKYVPVETTVGRSSQYRDNEYALEGLEGFWMWPEKSPLPKEGEKYRFWLTTKPKGGRAKPGSKYQDIVRAEPIIVDGDEEFVDVSEPSSPTDAPVQAKEVPVEDVPPVSPLAGKQVPAEWTLPVDYYIWRHDSDRLSIETQTALKAMVEVLPSIEDPTTRLQFTSAIMELSSRLGRFTWPDVTLEDA